MKTAIDVRDPNDPALEAWLAVPPDSDWTVQNLPFGIVSATESSKRCAAVAIGDHVLDLAAAHEVGLLDGLRLPRGVFASGSLNAFLSLGHDVWSATRNRISTLLCDQRFEREARSVLLHRGDVESHLPVEVGDFVDFYSSLHHATNLGYILRPGVPPLAPNWRHMPIGYHGRAGTVVVSGTPITRPRGMVLIDGSARLAPSLELDFELEVGFVVGAGAQRGVAIEPDKAGEHIFGVVLLNDWSARDIQSFEYQPLGPFLGKSFATTISPWIVTLDALRPWLVDSTVQDPEPERYLRASRPWALDIELEVACRGEVLCRTGFRHQYWTFAQQLAHLAVNGAGVRSGDLFASGAVSGPNPGELGTMIEITRRGAEPYTFSDGAQRRFLEDGDTVVLRGRTTSTSRPSIGFGVAEGTILGAGEG